MIGFSVRENGKVTQDFSKGHLLIAPGRSPKHFDIVPISPAAITAGAGVEVKNIIYSIKHNLGYTPKVDCYFFPAGSVPDNPDAHFQTNGTYFHNWYPFVIGGVIIDALEIKTNDTSLDIIYHYLNPSGGTSSPVPLKMKYSIFSNKGYAQY